MNVSAYLISAPRCLVEGLHPDMQLVLRTAGVRGTLQLGRPSPPGPGGALLMPTAMSCVKVETVVKGVPQGELQTQTG